jgi:NAD(P)-dependent dehydrogenase (short-subunit alcohol dehydrogenase family)
MILKNKNIVLTGASGGIGNLIAKRCNAEGANLFLISRSQEKLQELVSSLDISNGKAHLFVLDISNDEAVNIVISQIDLLCKGQIHVLINNAGIQNPIGPFVNNSLSSWKENININLFGMVNMIHAVLPSMIRNHAGKIINFSGGGSTSPRVNFSAYGIAKAAIVRFSETIALELRKHQIYVNSVAPGAINTSMMEEILVSGENAGDELVSAIGRKKNGGDDPNHILELISFLASDDSAGITGKLISAVWDPWKNKEFQDLLKSDMDIATLRRIDRKHYIKKNK